jgi:hypothetical protein
MSMVKQIEEITGVKPGTLDVIFQEVKANSKKLDGCIGPHDFTICLDRRTKEPIVGVPTPAQRFGAWWRCSKCEGQVENLHKIWYLKGMDHGFIHASWLWYKNIPRQSTPSTVSTTPPEKETKQ